MIEVLAMWDITSNGCIGYILVTDSCKILMEQTKVYDNLKAFKEYIRRVFYNNERFVWNNINICEPKRNMKFVGVDRKN